MRFEESIGNSFLRYAEHHCCTLHRTGAMHHIPIPHHNAQTKCDHFTRWKTSASGLTKYVFRWINLPGPKKKSPICQMWRPNIHIRLCKSENVYVTSNILKMLPTQPLLVRHPSGTVMGVEERGWGEDESCSTLVLYTMLLYTLYSGPLLWTSTHCCLWCKITYPSEYTHFFQCRRGTVVLAIAIA